MRTTALKRSLIAAIALAVLAACNGSTNTSAAARSATDTPSGSSSTSIPPPQVQIITDTLNGGLYKFGPFGDVAKVIATGPTNWVGYPDWAMDAPEPRRADAPDGIGIAFFTTNGVYSDPCHWDWQGTGQSDTGDVKVGPTVDDLVAALRANTYYASSAPKPVTIDGYSGKELELQMPNDSYVHCDKDDPKDPGGHVFVFPGSGLYAQGPANRWHLYILNVHGERLISVILSYAKTPRTDLDTAHDVIDGMDIQA